MSFYNNFPAYVTIDELRYKNQKKRVTYLKKHLQAKPLIGEQKLGKTWWGKAWNQNLERYSDFENRLGRGKKYVKAEAIFDFQIEKGKIYGDIAGSGRSIYHVEICIDPINTEMKTWIQNTCQQRISSMEELLQGKFPKDLKELFFEKDKGLFPSASQIHLSCDCPDYAYLCKHVAAMLYATSICLDENPALFLELRGIVVDDMIKQVLGENVDVLVHKAKQATKRILDETDLDALFHLE